MPHPAGPTSSPESGDSVADCSPPGTARSRSGLRSASPRWTHQQPSKVATVWQIAASQGRRGPAQICA
eukprot:4685741-Pyramimonas_sp.AAC.1